MAMRGDHEGVAIVEHQADEGRVDLVHLARVVVAHD